MQPMQGGNLLLWIRLDPSAEEKRSEDDIATIDVCWWVGWRKSCAKCDRAWCGHTWTRACLHELRGLGVSMARERERGQMHARQLAHDRACGVGTRLGCAGVSCVSWLAVDRHGHLIGSC